MGRARVAVFWPDPDHSVFRPGWQDLEPSGRVVVEVVGLLADTTYRYRWESEDGAHVGREHVFSTLPENPVGSFEFPQHIKHARTGLPSYWGDHDYRPESHENALFFVQGDYALFFADGDYHVGFDPAKWPRPSLRRKLWLRFKFRVVHRAKRKVGYYRFRTWAYWTFTERGSPWGRPYWWLKRKGWIKTRPSNWQSVHPFIPQQYSDHDYCGERRDDGTNMWDHDHGDNA